MPTLPYIPEQITVHLGRPNNDSAENITVDFPYYIKNVASGELYPTWPENALRANIYAIVSYTLNRIYTEWYRSQGYDFDITSSIQYDQTFIKDRDIFEPINIIVDEIFNDYLTRQGNIEPLFAVYCDGREVADCGGLTQWGSVDLARQGYIPYNILTYYYGDDINIVNNAPVSPDIPSYPGTPLSLGSSGNDVIRIQTQLNRISRNYPAIPKITSVSGVYDASTEAAVSKFQEVFSLPVTGVTDKSTWYRINYIFTSVKRLSQLNSEGLRYDEISLQFPEELSPGQSGDEIRYLQYFLSVIGAYYNAVPSVEITGDYDDATESAVKAFQQVFGLDTTGIVDRATWNDIYRAYTGIVENVPINIDSENAVLYPGNVLTEGTTSEYVRVLQEFLSYINRTYPDIPQVSATGYYGPVTRNAVIAFQNRFGLEPTGNVNTVTWKEISDVYYNLRYGYEKQPGQYPGYIIE